jgi:UDP-N-acetylmuramoyl-L-alanyl-D-glutamate--2,6-diaminopimelate ligase
MNRLLSDFASAVAVLERHGDDNPLVTGFSYDSRTIRRGFLFFAWRGVHSDGHRFIDVALDRGAVAVVHDRPLDGYRPGIAYLRVADARTAMGPLADAWQGWPSRDLGVIGVTGTEGKSSTVSFIWQLLRLCGETAGFFSTVEYSFGGEASANPEHQTTPEAPVVLEFLARMRENGCRWAVVESSSHGLSEQLNRLGEVAFDVGVVMNVTHEHLEFHGSWERYRSDKANLFRALDRHGHLKAGRQLPAFGVVNACDPSAAYFRAVTGQPVRAFAAREVPPGSPEPDLRALDVRPDAAGVSFVMAAGAERLPVRINLPGAFNVDNVMAACLAVGGLLGRPLAELAPLLARLVPVRGRMSVVDRGQPFAVLVDYAHTPSSFQAVLPPLRVQTKGRLICVFGSGGERDTQKRPEQGRIAAEFCDIVVLADEDPRGEEPMALLEEIAAGCAGMARGESLFLIPDRRTALAKAIGLARPGDSVVLLGKGHENSIIGKAGAVPWDELAEAGRALEELGYRA